MPKYVVNPPEPTEILINLAGPQGPKGDDGTSITIKGTFATAAELPATPTNTSDAYIVGSDLYIWTSSAWYNAGPFRGPKGDQGDPGPQGIQGLKGDKGDIGLTGLKGETGATGLTGAKGDKGDKGDTGNSGTYSQSAAGMPYVQGEGLIYIGVEFPTNFPDGSLFFKKV